MVCSHQWIDIHLKTEVDKSTLKSNTDEMLSNYFFHNSSANKGLNDDF
jgi:hypothetical protein